MNFFLIVRKLLKKEIPNRPMNVKTNHKIDWANVTADHVE